MNRLQLQRKLNHWDIQIRNDLLILCSQELECTDKETLERYLDSLWDSSNKVGYGSKFAVRYSATADSFSFKSIIYKGLWNRRCEWRRSCWRYWCNINFKALYAHYIRSWRLHSRIHLSITADYNGDGVVDGVDATLVLRFYTEKISVKPWF